MCMNVLPACKSVYHVNDCCLRKSEEGFRFPGTGDIDDWEPPWDAGNLTLIFCKSNKYS